MRLWHIKAEEFCGDEHEQFAVADKMTIELAIKIILDRTTDERLYKEDINSIEFKELKIITDKTGKHNYKITLGAV